MKNYYIYILSNQRHTVLYIGITNDLKRRIEEHKQKLGSKFTKKYNIDKLLYYEIYTDPENAIKREKQLKNYSRKRKDEIINQFNPKYFDLYNQI
ncbi:MAG: excinuclease ABC subunit C [Candidatus Magasanikbacteria bacterium RIFOXYB2_FULL_40_13]|uniref:Excinuclease ABC subunit C n=1 Tax=Candidatus Magasanikbacteria bacterium RIFOXYB1_FULL_40_15 TaxID=1798697 RepID=A0A1F6NG83_9BACT|nr:MAG: excinuclease ABC subunit C [Candidatus Magasanikbacteria bacterium RIFOXYB1_FULL_40_15]OGH86718.1 MAG: excinuclease ABC subunit C [Candidatus Magasanikbacteria bacterium RIFOXYB2_FULL_40_13]